MRRLSSISLEAGRRLHDTERRLVWSCFRRPRVMARCGGLSKRYGTIELCSIIEPASAMTAAWARCADKDSWVSSTIIRAIVRGIERTTAFRWGLVHRVNSEARLGFDENLGGRPILGCMLYVDYAVTPRMNV